MNKSDSERVNGFLSELGYKYNPDQLKAGIIILTTCGVRQSAEDRIYGLIPRIKRLNPKAKIILTGCLALRPDVKKRLEKQVDFWMPISQLKTLKDFLQKNTKTSASAKKDSSAYLKIPAIYGSSISASVPIGNGCDNFCAYCVVPYARGAEVYRPLKDIVSEVRSLVKNGYKEINLIAQNVNSYRDPNNNNFPKLLKSINGIPGEFWIRFLTSHPKDMSDELISTIKSCEKVCRYIHLPVQAGDNQILKAMNRKYTAGHYNKLILKIRKSLDKTKTPMLPGWNPPVSISTDLIVGFPGETKAQFKKSAIIFKEMSFDMAYISKYSPRPGTAAAKLNDDVKKSEKKRREEEIMKILRKTALANNKKYLGQMVKVLVEGKTKKGQWIGKTETYKVVKFKSISEADLTGKFISVIITNAYDFGLDGKL